MQWDELKILLFLDRATTGLIASNAPQPLYHESLSACNIPHALWLQLISELHIRVIVLRKSYILQVFFSDDVTYVCRWAFILISNGTPNIILKGFRSFVLFLTTNARKYLEIGYGCLLLSSALSVYTLISRTVHYNIHYQWKAIYSHFVNNLQYIRYGKYTKIIKWLYGTPKFDAYQCLPSTNDTWNFTQHSFPP